MWQINFKFPYYLGLKKRLKSLANIFISNTFKIQPNVIWSNLYSFTCLFPFCFWVLIPNSLISNFLPLVIEEFSFCFSKSTESKPRFLKLMWQTPAPGFKFRTCPGSEYILNWVHVVLCIFVALEENSQYTLGQDIGYSYNGLRWGFRTAKAPQNTCVP